MRTLKEFTKTTLIGGVLIIPPVYLAALLLAKTVKGMLELLPSGWPLRSQLWSVCRLAGRHLQPLRHSIAKGRGASDTFQTAPTVWGAILTAC